MPGLEPGLCRIWWAEPGGQPIGQAAHTLARVALGQVLQRNPADVHWEYRCATCGGPHGKPFLPVDPVEFSLSHAAGLVAVAVAADPVGLDVEVTTTGLEPDELASVALSEAERAWYAALPPAARAAAMLCIWTRKEALLKADGRGLSVSPDRVRVSAPDDPPAMLDWDEPEPPAHPQLADLDLGLDRWAAVAVLSPVPYRFEVQEHGW